MLLLTLLPLLLCNFVAAADVQQCLKTHIVINRSNSTNPYIPIERFNGLEYAYIATQTDVAPCEKLHYSWTLNPGNVQCSSGINPTLEEVEYAQRSFYDISCGAPSAFWKGTTARTFSCACRESTAAAILTDEISLPTFRLRLGLGHPEEPNQPGSDAYQSARHQRLR